MKLLNHPKEINMAFLKHIGKNGDRKVVVIFREIPGDEHMCLVIYPDVLPTHIHDPLMTILESPVGQQSENLADALNRNLLPDGRNALQVLHGERMMKRVRTDQVILTPNSRSTVKLSELNDILNQMSKGADAVKKMADIDSSSGMVDPKTKRAAEAAFKNQQQQPVETGYTAAPVDGALDDKALAASMLTQAKRMEVEANSMINEAARMKKEAEKMFPGVSTKAAPSTVTETVKTTAKRGRPAKAKAVVNATE
jgi:hypothetical protein